MCDVVFCLFIMKRQFLKKTKHDKSDDTVIYVKSNLISERICTKNCLKERTRKRNEKTEKENTGTKTEKTKTVNEPVGKETRDVYDMFKM
eukprot:UN20207